MKRHSFRTKNKLELYSLVYITLMCIILLVFFLILGNVGRIVRKAELDSGQGNSKVIEDVLKKGTGQIMDAKFGRTGDPASAADVSFTGGNGTGKVVLYGDRPILDSLASQMIIMDQSYDKISSLSVPEGCELLVVGKKNLSDEEVQQLTDYAANGVNIWITDLPSRLASNNAAKTLMGIETTGSRKSWPGVRVSGDIALGQVMEDAEYKVTALNLKLSNKIKLYASALPKNFKEMENKDLPPLIWRYSGGEGQGYVYVCNGDFMDTEIQYYMLPSILAELNANYAYGIINAYCVFVDGFPYAQNEERESWRRLYSRDKMQIAQDLISAQYLHYYTSYNSRITYFSRDYQEFLQTDDKLLKYYTDNIDNSMGLLAKKTDKGLYLESEKEQLRIRDWEDGFSFTEDGNFCLPINFEFRIEEEEEPTFNMLGSAVGLGYYAFSNNVEHLLDYDGEADVWDEYSKNQEVVFGIGVKYSDWLERLSAAQAVERLNDHLSAKTDITYSEDGIKITTDAEKYWLILKGKTQNIAMTGGTAKEIGQRCWLIEVDGGEAFIQYQ